TTSTRARCRPRCGSERCSSNIPTEMTEMTKRRFAKRLAVASILAVSLAAPATLAQQAEPPPKAGKPINAGDVLSGELNTMRVRGGNKGKRVATYQPTSEPPRPPPPNRLCTLANG